jgi:alpha-L-fucosidase
MEWWDNARFGMFIHLGLYSIPGGIWNGNEIEELGEWIMAYADIPVKDYKKLTSQFNPEKFNAKEWVRMAKAAGMKYMVITTRHHDGFCLFETKATDWDVMDATPFKRDIIKELNEECKKANIKFGVYYSILEWHHPAMELNTNFEDLEPFSDQAIEGGAFTNIDTTWRKYGNVKVAEGRKQEFIDYLKFQLKELIDSYDPAIIWFDGGWIDWWTPEDGKELLEYLWELNPHLIFNNRAGEDFDNDTWYGDYGTPEQSIPEEGLDYRWELCMTMNSTWGYKSYDQNWKSSQLLITQLVDITAKGGNFLLNIGPKADGSFPQESIERLNEISEWMKVNRDFIHSTKMWKPYMEGKHEMLFDYYDAPDVSAIELPFTAQDIRFTAKGNVVYAACLNWPKEDVKIKSMGKAKLFKMNITQVELLGSLENLSWSMEDNFLRISKPKEKPCKYVYVFKVTLESNL